MSHRGDYLGAARGSFVKARLALILLAVVALAGLSCATVWDTPQPNIVLVVVDAMRPDHIGCYGYGRPTSPNIDSLVADGVLFRNAISQAPWTKGSFSSILTSLYPFQHGVVSWESILSETLVTLPELLRDHGYHTMALLSIPTLAGRHQVMQGMQELSAPRMGTSGAQKSSGEALTDEAIELMEKSPQPFFILIHYYDVHQPYNPPAEYLDMVLTESDASRPEAMDPESRDHRRKALDVQKEQTITLYDAGIRYVDDQLGKIFAYLDTAGLTEETMLIITADHGEAFGEHDLWAHAVDLHDEAIKVPLIIRYPRKYRGRIEIDDQVGLIDLFPTIVELAGAVDDKHREGLSLNELIEEGRRTPDPDMTFPVGTILTESTLGEALTQRSLRTISWKMILEPATGQIRLYDLADDPGETKNIWGLGTVAEDSLLDLFSRIPGSSLRGWRIAFTGRPHKTSFRADIATEKVYGFTDVEELTRGTGLSVEIEEDSTAFSIEVIPRPTRLIWFDCAPYDAEIRVTITADGSEAPDLACTGSQGTVSIEETIVLRPDDAYGLPIAFSELRRSGKPGVYIWWLPGDKPSAGGRRIDLTPEEKKHLRALGYIQ